MSNIKIHYHNTNFREYYLLKFLEWISPLHANLICRKREAWQLSTKDLLLFPKESLGYHLGVFLQKHQLEPVPKAERHDCYHVLLDFETDLQQETMMQWFLIGSGKKSLFTLGAALLGLIVLPERLKYYYQSYKNGKHALNISNWHFKALLLQPHQQLQQLIFHKTPKKQ
jgi:ubiquinone biosynthesis protein Coq4